LDADDGEGCHLAVCQNLVPLVNIKIAGKWMFIPLKMVLIGIDPYPFEPLKNTWVDGLTEEIVLTGLSGSIIIFIYSY